MSHDAVNHSREEYVRYSAGDLITTSTVEGCYPILKRGMKGIYQHCAEKRLHRYLAEFDFRYRNSVVLGMDDQTRAELAIKGATGKRLTYRRSHCSKADTASACRPASAALSKRATMQELSSPYKPYRGAGREARCQSCSYP